jgi:Holliday junction resolvase RusA-like endonuclease
MSSGLAPALPLETPRSVSFQVFGIPKPKGSARGFAVMKAGKARAIVVADNSKALKSWEGAVRTAAQDVVGQEYFTEAVTLAIDFWFGRPKSVSAKRRPYLTTKPDLSKLVRSAEDALTGVLFRDDSQVVEIHATKRYVDGPAGARITVTEVR